MAVALNRRPRTPTAAALRPAFLRLAGIARYRPVQSARLMRAWPDSLPLHFIRCISLPLSFRLGLCFLCDPHDVLTASGKLGLLRVDTACGLISAGLQLIESGGAPVISGARSGNLGLRSSRLGFRGLWFRRGLGSCWPDLPGLQFELGRGGVRFFVPGLRLTLGRPRSALADGGLLLAVDRAVLTPSELEPVSGFEPLTCRLQEVCSQAAHALAAPMAQSIALMAPSSSRGESHPPALTEPCLTVSRYTALLI